MLTYAISRSKSAIVHEFVPAVVDAFIAGRLDSVEAAAEGRIEDPLDDVEMLLSQLEVLPYAHVCCIQTYAVCCMLTYA